MLEDFVHDLTGLVIRESEATRRFFAELWSLPVVERVARGRCIDALEFSSIPPDRFVRFRCVAGNNSDLREGDLVRLSRGDPALPILTGNLFRVEDDEVWLEPEKGWQKVAQELGRGHWVLDRSYLDLESFYRKALTDLSETARGRERILPLLAGDLKPQVDLERFEEACAKAEEEGVNESQAEAIAQAVATDLSHLVQGPPGTGKTFVLAQVVKQKVARGERVLITAATHRAIHNALNMIQRVAPEIEAIVKIGKEIYDPELRVQQYEAFSASPLTQHEGGYVVGATPFSLRSRRMRGIEFDSVIIDEAGQVTLPLALMAMLSAEAYIFIGDHRQLPPVLQSVPAKDAGLCSVFGRLSGRGFETMLEITYRMNAELARWPAESFYNGKLHPARENAGRRLALPQMARSFGEIFAPENPLVFVEMEHRNAKRFSNDEAILVADLLVDLQRAGFSMRQVAVVVPFRRQARQIRLFLKTRSALHDASECVIDTVDRMQGQERELVIVSMTASEPEYVTRLLDFILQPQRLNVAVTRARSKVILLASEQLAQAESFDPEELDLIALWKTFRAACHVIRL
ncbi:MAG: ATPase [Chthoniobacteraceae bacterium]|nr:ATPase [Chthoniobacteraceae bacterium]